MTRDAQPRPDSPCIKICALDEAGLCTGCLRNVTEIASWAAMSCAEQWQVLEVLKERRRLRAPQQEPRSHESGEPR